MYGTSNSETPTTIFSDQITMKQPSMAPLSFFKRKIAVGDQVVQSVKHLSMSASVKNSQMLSLSTRTESSASISDDDSANRVDSPFCVTEEEDVEDVTQSPQLKGMKHIIDDKGFKLENLMLHVRDSSSRGEQHTPSGQSASEDGSAAFHRKLPPRSPSQSLRKNSTLLSGKNSPISKDGVGPNSPFPPRSQSPRKSPESSPGKPIQDSQKQYDHSPDESNTRQRSFSHEDVDPHRGTTSLVENRRISSSRVNRRQKSPVFHQLDLDDLEVLKRKMKHRREKYGEIDYRVGQVWNYIGNYYFKNQEHAKALYSYKGAVMCYDGDDAHIGAAYGNIGTVYWTTGDLANAVIFLNKALEMYRFMESAQGHDPDSSIQVSNVLYQIGLVLSLQQNFKAAMSTLKYCRLVREKALGNMHLDLARTIDAIGKVHLFIGELDYAMACHQQALEMKRGLAGDSDSAVITSLMNIAAVHQAREMYDEAIYAYLAVLTVQKQAFLTCNVDGQALRLAKEAGETLYALAQIHSLNGNPHESSLAIKESLLFYREAGLSMDDPKVLSLQSMLV